MVLVGIIFKQTNKTLALYSLFLLKLLLRN